MGKKSRYDGVKEPKVLHLSKSQQTMRQEMLDKRAVLNEHDVLRGYEPKALGAVVDDLLGAELTLDGQFANSVPERCYEIINDPANHLVLSLQQWQVVQNMMERAMLTGYDVGMRSHG